MKTKYKVQKGHDVLKTRITEKKLTHAVVVWADHKWTRNPNRASGPTYLKEACATRVVSVTMFESEGKAQKEAAKCIGDIVSKVEILPVEVVQPRPAIPPGPVGAAVAPLKDQAMQSAKEEVEAYIQRISAALKKAGNDLDVAAPYPDHKKISVEEYHKQMNRYSTFRKLTQSREAYRKREEPNLADMCPDKVLAFTEETMALAAREYEDFVWKLSDKIGPCETATLEGNYVWSFSVLHIVKAGGVKEKWKTQRILNFSKYGLPFNQYPSRKIK